MKNKYHYATVDAATFLAAAHLATPKDSYLSQDEELKAVREVFAKGYRFVCFSPDGELALFVNEGFTRIREEQPCGSK